MTARKIHWMGPAKAALIAGAALAAAPALAQEGGAQLEEIVVTAQKREQNLQDVPVAVTAISQASLQANRVVDVRDLNALAPNLTVRVASGGASIPTYSMRGLVTGGGSLGSDRGISVYIDGVYVQSATGSIFQFADLQRIEVLRGPQGTLFGRNATGGAISMVTRDPSGAFGVHQELSFGDYSQFRSKTRLDLPKLGPFSAAVTYVHSTRDGDIRNLGAGAAWNYANAGQSLRVSPKRLGDSDVNAVLAAVKFEPSDRFSATYKFDYAEDHFTPEGQGVAFLDIVAPSIAGIIASQPDPAILTPVTNKRPDAVNNWFATPSYVKSWGHALTARYQVNDQISLKNIVSARESYVGSTYQLDGLGGLKVAGFPFLLLANTGEETDKQWSDEAQLNWSNKLFTLTAGYIHFENKSIGGGYEGVANAISFVSVPNFTLPAVANFHSIVKLKSDAAYAQLEGHVTSQLDLVGGWRLTTDRKSGVDRTVIGLSQPIHYRKSRPTYLVGVTFRPMEGVLTYAKYSTGFISGGFLASRAYLPEIAKSYEAGVKADLLDRRLRTNLAVFDAKYTNLQLTTAGANLTPPNPAGVVLINAADAKAKGFEWENTLVPLQGVTLGANVGYTDFKYSRVDRLIGTLQNYIPLNRPKWTGQLSAQYEDGELARGGRLVLRLDANYRGKTNLAYTRIGGNPAAIAATTTDNTWIVNGRAAIADIDIDIGGGKGEVALWARNLFDDRSLANVSSLNLGALGSIFPASYERARTYGVDVTVDF
jgi:iron complex outermembrane receptor protein